MITIIRSAERHQADFGWLCTRWHFSFADYYDPANVHWGALRVFNDDVVRPGRGFDPHPHRDMEIVTYVLEGALAHRDNQGHAGVIQAGDIQVMSAGRGIVHSEHNASTEHPVHFLQLWILPRAKGGSPRWDQRRFSGAERAGRLLPVVSSGAIPGTLAIDQDAAIYVSALGPGEAVERVFAAGRKGYLFLIAGELSLNGDRLGEGDQARIAEEAQVRLVAEKRGELILLDLP